MWQGCFLICITILIISINKSQPCMDCLIYELVLTYRGCYALWTKEKYYKRETCISPFLQTRKRLNWLHHSKISLLITKVILLKVLLFEYHLYISSKSCKRIWNKYLAEQVCRAIEMTCMSKCASLLKKEAKYLLCFKFEGDIWQRRSAYFCWNACKMF